MRSLIFCWQLNIVSSNILAPSSYVSIQSRRYRRECWLAWRAEAIDRARSPSSLIALSRQILMTMDELSVPRLRGVPVLSQHPSAPQRSISPHGTRYLSPRPCCTPSSPDAISGQRIIARADFTRPLRWTNEAKARRQCDSSNHTAPRASARIRFNWDWLPADGVNEGAAGRFLTFDLLKIGYGTKRGRGDVGGRIVKAGINSDPSRYS